MRLQKRATLARISSAVLVQTKGLGRALVVSIWWRMACSSSRVERSTPRRICFSVRAANQRSTRFSQGSVGRREMHVKTRMPGQPAINERCFMRAVVVQNQMHVQPVGNRGFDAVQELAELHRAVPGVEIAYHASAFHLQRREQRGGAVPHIVVC